MVFKNKEWLHVYSYLFIYFVSFYLKKKKKNTKHYHPEALDIPKTYQTEFFSTT